jgi:glycosyltransferase involved in cell wall biosynthesis
MDVENLILVSQYFPPAKGGVARHVYELANSLTEKGVSVAIVTISNTFKLHYQIINNKLEIFRLSIPRVSLPIIGYYSSTLCFSALVDKFISNILKKRDIDGIQFSNISGFVTLLKREMNVPLVTKVHGTWILNRNIVKMMTSTSDLLLRPTILFNYLGALTIDKICYHHSDKIITIREKDKSYLIQRLKIPPEKVSVIYNGVNHKMFNPYISGERTRRELKIDNSSLVVLYLGDFSPLKGFHLLPYIVREISKKLKNVIFIIAGSYDETKILKVQNIFKKLGLSDKVRIIGFIPYEKTPEFYAASDVVIIPELTYTITNVHREALACGKPIVTFECDGIENSYDKKIGFIIKPGDIRNFIESTAILLEDETLRKNIGKNAHKYSLKWSWEKVAEETLQIFLNVKK